MIYLSSINYTADDGLNFLDQLGLAVSPKEVSHFRDKWNDVYEMRNGDLTQTTWTLYASVLPFLVLPEDERQAYADSRSRDSEFAEKLGQAEGDCS